MERKGETRRRIVETASRRFRGEGVDGVGIAALMAEAGLTNGAFYAHFDSKEDLVREAVVDALITVPEALGLGDDSTPADLRRFIEAYLSADHRDHVAEGCAMAALIPDLSRRPFKSRRVFQESGKPMIDRIAAALPEPIAPEDRLLRAFSIFSLLLGTLQMARFVSESAFSDAILARGRAEAMRLAGFHSLD
jgi:TetR/AcrR family transcriptional repressor of nem operon